jgi:hypothetical protein
MMMCNLLMASYHLLNPFLLHTYTITLGRTSKHHVKDDSQSNNGKSKGKGPSTGTTGTQKNQAASPASVKNKPSPSVSRSVGKQNRKRQTLDASGSEKDDSDFEKTPATKKQRSKKQKSSSKKSRSGVNNDVGDELESYDPNTPSRYVRICCNMSSY